MSENGEYKLGELRGNPSRTPRQPGARFLLYRKNDTGVHEPSGAFDTATLARDFADQDGQMRGLVDKPYQWGEAHQGWWVSVCPDYPSPTHPNWDDCNDYIIVDTAWKSPEALPMVVELPPDESGAS